MQLLAGLVCYLLAMTALIGGGVAAFTLFIAEPAGSRPAPAPARHANVPPKIADWLERKAERHQPPAPVKTTEPAQTPAPVAAEPARPDENAGRAHPARTKKSQRAIARRAPAPGGDLALGYAPAPSRPAYAASIFRPTDRMGD